MIGRILLLVGATALLLNAAGPHLAPPSSDPAPHGGGGLHPGELPPEVCGAGCSAVPPLDDTLARVDVERWLARYAAAPVQEPGEALETLLFHAGSTRAVLADGGGAELDAAHRAFLEAELVRGRARISLRVIDLDGVERVRLEPALVPLGEKQHLHPTSTTRLQRPEISFTVRRVGLSHLWARL